MAKLKIHFKNFRAQDVDISRGSFCRDPRNDLQRASEGNIKLETFPSAKKKKEKIGQRTYGCDWMPVLVKGGL